jgi:hypothetical protein
MNGRPKNIETPEMMWKHFLDYKTWVKNNPIEIEDYVGGVGKRVVRQKPRPLTNEGFNMYLYHNDQPKGFRTPYQASVLNT